jgi:hypothetical protein
MPNKRDDTVDVVDIPTVLEVSPIANLYCPSAEWEETARKIAKIRGARFTIVCPREYRSEHFPAGVCIGQKHDIFLNSGLDGNSICGAMLNSFETVQIWNLSDKQLKGVLGVQFVVQLLEWFNTSKFIEMIGVKHPRFGGISYDDYLDIAEFSVAVLATDREAE